MEDNNEKIRVWDPFVRFFHWGLVLAFIISYLSADELETVHVYSGYFITALLLGRIIWGVIGSKYARFSNFVRPWSEIKGYLRGLVSGNSVRHLGHNPAGGAMTIALILCLSLSVLSGLKTLGAEGEGPFAVASYAEEGHDEDREQDDDAEEFWEEIHEFFVNASLLLIVLHITGVIASSLAHRENLAKAMISGDKYRLPTVKSTKQTRDNNSQASPSNTEE
ncbi:MAG: cytochrome b/b6 domain-containing protein [Spongiibacteraceae bacterium]